MPLDPKFTLTLDRERELRWTMRAEAKLGRLPDPPPLQDIASRNPRRGYFALLAYLWAAVEDPAGDFPQPEDLADHLQDAAAQAAGFAVLIQALRAAGRRARREQWAHAIIELGAPGPAYEEMTPLEHRYLMSAHRKKLRREGYKFNLEQRNS